MCNGRAVGWRVQVNGRFTSTLGSHYRNVIVFVPIKRPGPVAEQIQYIVMGGFHL